MGLKSSANLHKTNWKAWLKRLCAPLAISGMVLLCQNPADASPQSLTFGIVPQQSASKLARLWSPILRKLSQKSGYQLIFKTAPNIPIFEQRLAEGQYDIAYMNPYHFTLYGQKPGYKAFAKAKNHHIRGIIVIRADSPINQIEQLNNTTLAFPAPAAFAASVLTRTHLMAQQIQFIPKYVSSHDSVYRTVAKGLYPAGGGIIRTFNNIEPGIRQQLKIFWTSQGYTPHAFAAHPRLPNDVIVKLQSAMTHFAQSPDQQFLLNKINLSGFAPALSSDWDDVRALNIPLLKPESP